jgi:PAS domain S-box-containing protein
VYLPVLVSLGLAGVVASNPWHGAYLEPVPGSRSSYGPLAVLTGLYSHGMSATMVLLYALLRRRHRSWLVRRKTTLMILAYSSGPVFNLLYVLPASVPPFDLTVLSLVSASSLVMLGVYRTGLFNPLPVALPNVISNDPTAVVLLDPNGFPFFANPAARALLPPSTWDAPLHAQLARRLRRPRSGAPVDPAEIEHLLAAESGRVGRLYRLDGDPPRWLRIQRSAIRSRQGLEIGSCVRFSDVGELLDAESRVEEGEERFRALADHACDFIAEFGAKGEYLYANPRLLEVFGERADWVGSAVSLLEPDARTRAEAQFAKLVATGETSDLTFRCLDKHGQERWLEVTARAYAGSGGETRVVAIGRDVSERHRLHEARRLESLGALAGGIARDLNALLVPILGNVSFLLEEVSRDDETERALGEIEGAAGRAADLVARLMTYVGETPLERRPVNLRSLVRELRGALEADPARRGALHFELAPVLPVVHADPERLRQVLLALVRNAWEALPERGGSVTLSTSLVAIGRDDLVRGELEGSLSDPGRYVRLAVRDDGCGVDAELRGRIFDPFFSTRSAGRGLGLAIALGIVRAHRGALRVRSEPGRGSVFEVLLPEAD